MLIRTFGLANQKEDLKRRFLIKKFFQNAQNFDLQSLKQVCFQSILKNDFQWFVSFSSKRCYTKLGLSFSLIQSKYIHYLIFN